MSAQATMNSGMGMQPVLSPMNELVDSIKESATKFHASSKSISNAQQLRVVETDAVKMYVADAWSPVAAPSRLGKGGMFGLVVLFHALAVIALASIRGQEEPIEPRALQVAIVSAPQSNEDVPPPPKPVPPPVLSLPVEPVFIDIAVPETTAITVAARAVEPVVAATSATTGTPKTVSTVEYIREPQPKYPSAARALKQRGTVMLRVLVDADGHAQEINLHRTSGYRALDEAARKAVLDAQFKPYTENGRALPVYVFVPIEFGAA